MGHEASRGLFSTAELLVTTGVYMLSLPAESVLNGMVRTVLQYEYDKFSLKLFASCCDSK